MLENVVLRLFARWAKTETRHGYAELSKSKNSYLSLYVRQQRTYVKIHPVV